MNAGFRDGDSVTLKGTMSQRGNT